MRVKINGEKKDVPDQLSLEALIRLLDLTPERLALELNRRVVRRSEWSETLLAEDDSIEIVHFVGGGG